MKRLFKTLAIITLACMTQSCGIFSSLPDSGTVVYQSPYVPGPGSIAARVSNIDIDWLDGMVDVIYDNVSQVEFFEGSDRPLNDSNTMHTYFDGSTLHIRYGCDGALPTYAAEKRLTVHVPVGMTFNRLSISATSCSVFADLDATSAEIVTESGEIRYGTMVHARSIRLASGSGLITLLLPEDASVKLKTIGNGHLSSEFAFRQFNNYFICGSGYTDAVIESASGEIAIYKNHVHVID